MHYLIVRSKLGDRLVDFGLAIGPLASKLEDIKKTEKDCTPAVYSYEVVCREYLTDERGMLVLEDGGYLIAMEDLV